jgi:hypothetical protein
MALRHVQAALQGLQIGIDLRNQIENTRSLLDDRAAQQRAKQVGEETAKAMKAVDAPWLAHVERKKLYRHEVLVGRKPRDLNFEMEITKEEKLLQSETAHNKLDIAMNTMAANPDNKYIEEAMKNVASNSLAVFQTLKEESMQHDRAVQLEEQRKHETALQDDKQAGDVAMETQQHGNRMEEQALSNKGQLDVAQTHLAASAIDATSKADQAQKTDFVADYDQTTQTVDAQIAQVPPEEILAEAESRKMTAAEVIREKKQKGAYDVLKSTGKYSDAQLAWLKPQPKEEKPADTQSPLAARIAKIAENIADPRTDAGDRRRLKAKKAELEKQLDDDGDNDAGKETLDAENAELLGNKGLGSEIANTLLDASGVMKPREEGAKALQSLDKGDLRGTAEHTARMFAPVFPGGQKMVEGADLFTAWLNKSPARE